MQITFNGDPITLVGNMLKVGDDAPDFLVVDNTLKDVKYICNCTINRYFCMRYGGKKI